MITGYHIYKVETNQVEHVEGGRVGGYRGRDSPVEHRSPIRLLRNAAGKQKVIF